jgi:hypothetical protein
MNEHGGAGTLHPCRPPLSARPPPRTQLDPDPPAARARRPAELLMAYVVHQLLRGMTGPAAMISRYALVLLFPASSALWNRFVIELVRALAARCGLGERPVRELVRVAYVKVAEFQLRGLMHFHAIIRLDGAEDRGDPPGLNNTAPPAMQGDPPGPPQVTPLRHHARHATSGSRAEVRSGYRRRRVLHGR